LSVPVAIGDVLIPFLLFYFCVFCRNILWLSIFCPDGPYFNIFILFFDCFCALLHHLSLLGLRRTVFGWHTVHY